jgi:hypothetical protein
MHVNLISFLALVVALVLSDIGLATGASAGV